MSSFLRFFFLGADDADRRVAAFLRQPPLEAADRYLKESVIISVIDRATQWLFATWRWSALGRGLAAAAERLGQEPWQRRYRAFAVFLLAAVGAHVALVTLHGPRPGWFWIMVPAQAALYAVILIAASRSARSPS